nr:RNA-directed DNA polymerase, eukaryota [Tanacetum cinerariifolium]
MHLQANVARFERESLPSKRVPHKFNQGAPPSSSFVSVVKGVLSPPLPLSLSPALVLDDSCLVERDLDNFVMGEVRLFSSINNRRVLLHNEGFTDIEIVYLGGLWVLIKLGSAKAKLNFMKHTRVDSWFVRICNAQNDFVANDRIVWVDIEGVPLHAWSNATFHKIGKVFPIRAKELFVWSPSFKEVPEVVHFLDDESVKKDAVINEVNNSVSTKGEESESEAVSDTVFGDNGDTLDHDNEVDQSLNDKEVSNDPFKIYELLNKNKNGVDNSGKEYNIPYPSGFTPDQANVTFVQEAQEIHGEDNGRVIKDARKETGSILDILNEMIKVSVSRPKKIGFGKVSFLSLQETKKESFLDLEIKYFWGNYQFHHIVSEALGYSGGLMEVQLEGYSFTWTHPSALKMSKLDRFLVSDGFLSLFPHISTLQDLNSSANSDFIQKAKVRWAIEGDENSKFFHGLINRKCANLSVKGIMIDGEWVDDPIRVKEEFRNHFPDSFNYPGMRHGRINFDFRNRLNPEQVFDLETSVLDEEICKAVWSCGENKSPGPDGFTFEFFRKFWLVVGLDFYIAVKWFFDHGVFATGCNSSFVTLIPKTLDPKLVNEFRPISLIGSLYKVVTKILATRLSFVISDLISDVQSAFLPNRQILDGPFIINDTLARCKHKNHRTMFFKVDFAKAYDSIRWDYLDDVLSAFGFGSRWRSWIRGSLNSGKASILVNGSPTSEFQFHCGLKQGDPLALFLFILIMESLYLAFNRAVDTGIFSDAAASLGCSVMKTPFNYLGIMVGGNMSLVKSWDESIHKLMKRLSRWKLKTLSIGGRFTLLKLVIGSTPIYNMSIFKVPKSVLNKMESLRRDFFNGNQEGVRKVSWVKWQTVLADKKFGGLGVSSLFALNRGLLAKWVWRFLSQDNSLWCQLISVIHGSSITNITTSYPSTWNSIIKEFNSLKVLGVDVFSHCKIRIGNGLLTRFWKDLWIGDCSLLGFFPRMFALELDKDISVAAKLQASLFLLFDVIWVSDLNRDGVFRVKDVRNLLDGFFFLRAEAPTRNVAIDSQSCPLCDANLEDSSHLFFNCSLARDVMRLVCRWWNLDMFSFSSYAEWLVWFNSIRLVSKLKVILEGVFYVMWWSLWNFWNHLLFASIKPRKEHIFDDIVLRSFSWCKARGSPMLR